MFSFVAVIPQYNEPPGLFLNCIEPKSVHRVILLLNPMFLILFFDHLRGLNLFSFRVKLVFGMRLDWKMT